MKKWFAMFLVSLMLITCIVYSHAAAELEIGEEKMSTGALRGKQEEETMREDVPIRMSSEVRIQFEYNNGRVEDLDQINRMLAEMELTDVEVKDLSAYLCTTQKLDHEVVVGTTYRCGLNGGTLVCQKADFEKTYRYQISTEVFEANAMEDGVFVDYWREKYPERRLSTIVTCNFDTHEAFVVVYFEEIAH